MQETNLGDFMFARTHAGACARTRVNTGKYVLGTVFKMFAKFLGEFNSLRIHAAPVFAPARIQETIPGKLCMYKRNPIIS